MQRKIINTKIKEDTENGNINPAHVLEGSISLERQTSQITVHI